MKPQTMKPQTIADLKIEWTFETEFDKINCNKFTRLNPNLVNTKLKEGDYNFTFENYSFRVSPYQSESLGHFIDYLSYHFLCYVGKKVKLSHFEKLSETEYRIHGKEL